MFANLQKQLLYFACGRSFKHFLKTTHAVEQNQQKTLRRILKKNQQTDYGKQYQFSACSNLEDYKRSVPIIDSNTVKPLLKAVYEGDYKKLVAREPSFFGISSGTTGAQKYVLFSKDAPKGGALAVLGFYYHMAQSYPCIFQEPFQFLVDCLPEQHSPTGVPVGYGTGRNYKQMPNFFTQLIPTEVFELEDVEDKLYLMGLFLAGSDVSGLNCLSCESIIHMAKVLEHHIERLRNDLLNGQISLINHPQSLPPNVNIDAKPELAKNIRDLQNKIGKNKQHSKDFSVSLMELLFPNLKVIGAWTNGTLAYYIPDLKQRFPRIEVFDLPLNSTESTYGIPLINTKGSVAISDGNIMEFIPQQDWHNKEPSTLNLWQLQTGHYYSLVVTNGAGIYRCRFGDIVKVSGFYNQAPVLEFVCKESRTVRIADSDITFFETLFSDIMCHFKIHYSIEIADFVVFFDDKNNRFLMMIEESISESAFTELQNSLENQLKHLSETYRLAIEGKKIRPIHIETGNTRQFQAFHQAVTFAKRKPTFQAKPLFLCPDFGKYHDYFATSPENTI